MNRILLITISTALLIVVSGCDKASSEQASNAAIPAEQPQTNAWLLTDAPEGAVSIIEAKESMKEGDTVTIRGRIGGRHSPISAESPVFTIVDLELPYCGQHEDDNCGTPWDYCCETPSTITNNSATVQIIGDGIVNPIAGGLKPLNEIILIGTVGPRPTDQVFTIRATGVYLVTE